MQKALFFTAALIVWFFVPTYRFAIIQSLHIDQSSLKWDENSTGQGSNSKAHINFFEVCATLIPYIEKTKYNTIWRKMQCAAVTSTVFITDSKANAILPRGWIPQLEQYKASPAHICYRCLCFIEESRDLKLRLLAAPILILCVTCKTKSCIRNKGRNVGLKTSISCGITYTRDSWNCSWECLELTILESGSRGNILSVIPTGQLGFRDQWAITETCPSLYWSFLRIIR